ncbi:hypothetical protein CONPUDRAFT_76980 [Coniophora puteana RWD-64-598 SS2]|uniref:DUF6533 domain-containing protein n=1 Tax=Coniophora puteana (strain RWD-64-598) TaxID=741705 RepID=A0A5M3M9S6_CONPW|nr:uncharacterized protein CONPUDRAFT_76980 [Coniophora puteana RWD-64-598 SS2]EIW75939.1 hypothetical protein CONPUDRAFT_76980 [Coniophora puteana RWD-64-598 SS2]
MAIYLSFKRRFDPSIVACLTWMSYDYLLSLNLEEKKFTPVSLVYGLLRYAGMLWAWSQGSPVFLWFYFKRMLTYKCELGVGSHSFVVGCIVAGMIVIFLLQGMMALRVYVLLQKSKRILFVIIPAFLASQGTVLFSVITISERGGSSMPVTLFVLCSRYAIKRLERPLRWASTTHYASSLALFVIKQNLFYFIISFVAVVVTLVGRAPAPQSSAVYKAINSIIDFYLFTMIGPWSVLRLRDRHEEDVNGYALRTIPATTLRFADTDTAGGA